MVAGSRGGTQLDFAVAKPESWRLANGLTVLHIPVGHASLVTTVLSYRVGAADERANEAGAAHFLEHMMFKGSAGFGPGEIDRRTQLLGGWNNAFTSHDATAYMFGFASDRWQDALAIEADRMKGLTLDSAEVDSERRVIEEEISMYMDDPWDSLELEVQRRVYGDHPYGRAILGTVESLASIDSAALGRFHADFYGPSNAVLAVAGDVPGSEVKRSAETHFADIEARPIAGRPERTCPVESSGMVRIERRKGETPRFLLALPAPPATDVDHGRLLLATTILGAGRASRLHQRLVEELRLCSSVSAEVTESVDPAVSLISAEAMPGAAPEAIEIAVGEVLNRLRREPPEEAELDRARSVLVADWIFSHERVHQRAMVAANAETLFDAGHPERHLRAACDTSAEDLVRLAGDWLMPEKGSVVGWSLSAGL